EIQRVTGATSDEAAWHRCYYRRLRSTLPDLVALPHPHKQSVTVWVKSTGDYGILLKMLASPLEHVEAEILRKATKGLRRQWIYRPSIHTSTKAAADADALYKAGEGRMGTDETTFINILRALLFLVRSVLEPVDLLAELFETTLKSASRVRSCVHIQGVVSGEYRQLLLSVFDAAEVEFGLTVWVKSTGDYGILLKMLASPLERDRDSAQNGLGRQRWIYPVVINRSNAEIALLKKTFQEKYGDDLVKILSGELSGDLKKVILAAMHGDVPNYDARVTSVKAATDADVYKAGARKWGTDEEAFIRIVVSSP
ncbi:Annexin (Annexin) Family, partial [Phytophthora cinnamomi]|uniref:Annexin (Annexin) Family n=1 Tax=Phytophthora cinnamomi TaxID=4785 RepID=UPI00355A237D